MADLTTLRAWLTDAEEALHKLEIGVMEVSLGSGDSQVSYNRADVDKLQAYINKLEAKIAKAEGVSRAGSRHIEVVW